MQKYYGVVVSSYFRCRVNCSGAEFPSKHSCYVCVQQFQGFKGHQSGAMNLVKLVQIHTTPNQSSLSSLIKKSLLKEGRS